MKEKKENVTGLFLQLVSTKTKQVIDFDEEKIKKNYEDRVKLLKRKEKSEPFIAKELTIYRTGDVLELEPQFNYSIKIINNEFVEVKSKYPTHYIVTNDNRYSQVSACLSLITTATGEVKTQDEFDLKYKMFSERDAEPGARENEILYTSCLDEIINEELYNI